MSGHHSNSCLEYLGELYPGYRLLHVVNPTSEEEHGELTVWVQRTKAWDSVYLCSVVISTISYLTIGVLAALCLLVSQGSRMKKTRTVCVIYTCIALLGFSRALVLLLDPYGMFGWIADRWEPWIIVSRLVSSLGFPCLTASYTLIFLTLWRANNPQDRWKDSWPIILSIALPHFIVALIAETIANTSPFPALVSLIICDGVFIAWGVTISTIFLVAGWRLVRVIKDQAKETSRMSGTYSKKEYNRRMDKMEPVVHKIIRITYATAILTILYSAVSTVSLVLMSMLVFSQCLGYNDPGNAAVWLGLQIVRTTVEVMLGFVILYSMTNVSLFLKSLKTMCHCCRKLHKQNICKKEAVISVTNL